MIHYDRLGWTLTIGCVPTDIRDIGKWWTWGIALAGHIDLVPMALMVHPIG